jgi:hypothetical protein
MRVMSMSISCALKLIVKRLSPAFVSIDATHVVSDADAARCCRAFSQASTHLVLSALDRCERTDRASANRADPPIAHVHQPGAEQIRRHVTCRRPSVSELFRFVALQ